MPATYEPIATTTLGSASNSVTFSSISGTYTDLVMITSINEPTNGTAVFQVGNGSVDTGANYSRTFMFGDGTSAVSGRTSNLTLLYTIAATASNTFATGITQFMNYSNTTTNKGILIRSNNTSTVTVATAALWRSTSAINIIKIYAEGAATFAIGSTFTLYGIKSA